MSGSLPIHDFGGRGAAVHLAVANGFPPQTYGPLLEPLTERYHIISVLPRALWNDPPPPKSLTSWQQIADDLLAALRERDLTEVIAIGHSMGGVATMLAAIAEPARFRALILLDPTFLPPHILLIIQLSRILGQGQHMPLIQGALRRRAQFATVEEAYQYWRAKQLFRDWPERSLRLYAESLTRPSKNGGGVELAWSPRWEARYYQHVTVRWWLDLPRLPRNLPVLAVQGARTDTFTDTSVRIARFLLPHATYKTIEGRGHLFPLAAPDETRLIFEEWLVKG